MTPLRSIAQQLAAEARKKVPYERVLAVCQAQIPDLRQSPDRATRVDELLREGEQAGRRRTLLPNQLKAMPAAERLGNWLGNADTVRVQALFGNGLWIPQEALGLQALSSSVFQSGTARQQ